MSRTSKYTDMGWPEENMLWRYDLLTEPLLSSELSRLARAKTHNNTDCITFQPCPNPDESNQDRYAVFDWSLRNGTWKFRAVFDGHAGHDTADHVMNTLPSIIHKNLSEKLISQDHLSADAVSELLTNAITSIDENLTHDLLAIFPNVDAISTLSDDEIVKIINDQGFGGINSSIVTRCMRGTTVLISLVDPTQSNIWIASLGDCQAALGVHEADGHWETLLLSSFHNGGNAAERERIRGEHPGEAECIVDDRVLGAIAVTRAIGDHLFKLPRMYTERIFLNARPGFLISKKISDFLNRNSTPPYISNCAEVRHVRLEGKESIIILCSDGLVDLYEGKNMELDSLADHWIQLLARERESPSHDQGKSNLALYLLRHGLGGKDIERVSRMMTVDMPFRWMDDTTIIVQKF